MATDNIIGIAMQLDVSDLKAGIQETQRQITTANKEFKSATAGMDDWRKSSEGLTAKLKQLDTTLDMQTRQLRGYQAELKRVTEEHGENSEQARKLRDKILDVQASIGRTEKSQRYYKAQLEEVSEETKQATTLTGKLSKAFEDAGNSSGSLKGGLSTLKIAMGNLVANGISALVGGLRGAVEQSKEFRRELGYLEETAKSTDSDFDQIKETLKEVTAITDDQGAAVEGLNNLMSAGFKSDTLDEITDQLVGASIKWKDTLKFEGLADGLQETLATGSAIGPFAQLLERAGLNLEEFDEGLAQTTTDAEAQNYVLQTLSQLGLSDIKKSYEESNKTLIDANKASFDYAEAQAQVSERVEPVMTSIKQGWVDVLNAFLDMSNGSDFQGLQASIKNAFQFFIDEVIPVIKEGIQFVIKNKDIILGLIAGIGAGFVAWKVTAIISGIVTATKAWIVATEGMTVAQRLLNLVMKANPIGIVITLITALVTAFVVLWNKSDAFRNFWIGLWNKIKSTAKVVVDWLVNAFKNTWTAIKNTWSVVVSWFQNVWNGIKKVFMGVVTFYATVYGNAWKAIKQVWSVVVGWFRNIWEGIRNTFSKVSSLGGFFSNAWNNIKSAWSGVKSWFSNIVDTIVSYFREIPGKMLGIGKDMINGLINGVKSVAGNVKDAVSDAVMGPVNWVKGKLGINSPSKLMRDEIGKMMGLGVGEGILDSTKSVLRNAGQFTDAVKGGLSLNTGTGIRTGMGGSQVGSSTTVTNNYTQVINAPKAVDRKEIYRDTRRMLKASKGVTY